MTDWQELSRLASGKKITIERVKIEGKDMAIEGQFELPPMARLSMDDQIFVAAFVTTHGSIKQMEHMFGVSYPTIKNRLNRLAKMLDWVQTQTTPSSSDILEQLERGELSVAQALERLKTR